MTIIFAIIFILTIIFLVYTILIYSALNKLFKPENCESSELKLSVVIAAKNEMGNIPLLITALKKQSYQSYLFEVIIVDDNSIDDTYKFVNSEIGELKNFRVIRAENKLYEAKKGALDIGIKHSSNPYIVITDADCIPSEDWLKNFADKFGKNNDLIFGIAPYKRTKLFINRIATFENFRSHIIMFAFAKLGNPYSAAARSFGFSKSAFEKMGGYKNTTETLSGDDDLLLREAIKNKLKIGFISSENAFVLSDTKKTFLEFINQKLRHTSTSYHYSLKNKVILGLWHITNIILLFSSILIFFNSVFILPVFIKIIMDIFLLNSFQKNFGYKFNLIEMLFLQILYELQLIYFFVLAKYFSKKWQ